MCHSNFALFYSSQNEKWKNVYVLKIAVAATACVVVVSDFMQSLIN